MFAVKRLLRSGCCEHEIQYWVDREGYGLEEQSWILAQFIVGPDLIRDFHHIHPNQPSLSSVWRRPPEDDHGAQPEEGGSDVDNPSTSSSLYALEEECS